MCKKYLYQALDVGFFLWSCLRNQRCKIGCFHHFELEVWGRKLSRLAIYWEPIYGQIEWGEKRIIVSSIFSKTDSFYHLTHHLTTQAPSVLLLKGQFMNNVRVNTKTIYGRGKRPSFVVNNIHFRFPKNNVIETALFGSNSV